MKRLFPERWKAALQCKEVFIPKKVVFIIGMILCLSLFSCDLFKTRTPQEPTQVSSNYVPPTDPEKVMQNMINAFHDKNKINYLYSFSDASFVFEATANARSTYESVFSLWNKRSEGDYFEKLMSKLQQNSFVTLTFGALATTPFVDSTQVETEYQLTVPHTEANIAKNFNGRVQFLFVRDQSGLWSLRYWLDINVGVSDSAWSDLKGIAVSRW
jgi:hypothetical protein